MLAVSNTSPLIVLSKLGYIDMLPEIFEKIYIPSGVRREISEKEDDVHKAVEALIERGFIEVKEVENRFLVQMLNAELGIGESEVIALGKEVKSDFVLLDDLKARQWARSFKMNVMGTLAIIRALVRRGIIKEAPDEIYIRLRSIDFWISRELFSSLFDVR